MHHERQLTRNLIEAEEGLALAQEAATKGGADLSFMYSGHEGAGEDVGEDGFVDDVADGYRLSFEQDMAGTAPVARIMNWMSNIPTEPSSPNSIIGDDFGRENDYGWEGEEHKIGRSWSIDIEWTSVGSRRKQIDEWQQVQQQVAAELALRD